MLTPRRSAETPSVARCETATTNPSSREVAVLAGPAEARLLDLAHEVEVFAIHLGMPVVDAGRLLAARAGDVVAALASLRAALADGGVLRPDDEAGISIDALRDLVARPAPMRQRSRLPVYARRIAEAAADLHGDVVSAVARARRRLERPGLTALRRFAKAHDELQVQLRAAAAVERLTRGLRRAELERRRRELLEATAALSGRLDERRDRLAAQRKHSAVLWRQLDADLRTSVEEVGVDLARLFDRGVGNLAPAGKTARDVCALEKA